MVSVIRNGRMMVRSWRQQRLRTRLQDTPHGSTVMTLEPQVGQYTEMNEEGEGDTP